MYPWEDKENIRLHRELEEARRQEGLRRYRELDEYLKTVIWDIPDDVVIDLIRNGADTSHTLFTALYPNLTSDGRDWWERRKRYQQMYKNLIRLQDEGRIYRKRTLVSAIIWGADND